MPTPEWLRTFVEAGHTLSEIDPLAREWVSLAYFSDLSATQENDLQEKTKELMSVLLLPERNNQDTAILNYRILERLETVRRFEYIESAGITPIETELYSWTSEVGKTYTVYVHDIFNDGKVIIRRTDGGKIKTANTAVVSPFALTRLDAK